MANTVYDKKLVEAVAKEKLLTKINFRSLMDIDTSLAQNGGETKIINVYNYDGEAEELAERQGNSKVGGISYTSKEYKVKTVQQHFDYTDEDVNKDASIVDMMLSKAIDVMTNKMSKDFADEAHKATKVLEFSELSDFTYVKVLEGIAELGKESTDGYFLVIPQAFMTAILASDNFIASRQGEVLYTGQIGTVAGIPVVVSNALTNEGYLLSKDAIRLFIKKDVEVESDRDIDKRITDIVVRAFYVCALVNDDKVVRFALK